MASRKPKRKRLSNWSHVKKFVRASAHVAFPDTENVECKVCRERLDLNEDGRRRSSVLLRFTREHFYRHSINETFAAPPPKREVAA